MAIISEGSLTIIVRTLILMVVFYFAGCAAGSCLSYGHSCWGAHGKRNGHGNNNPHLVPTRAMMAEAQQDVPSVVKEQWILSRLISGRPLTLASTKHRGKWSNFPMTRPFGPQRWDGNDVRFGSEDLIRARNENNNDEQSDKANEMQDGMRFGNEDREESPEIFLISRNEHNEQPNKPQNIDLFKLLSKATDSNE